MINLRRKSREQAKAAGPGCGKGMIRLPTSIPRPFYNMHANLKYRQSVQDAHSGSRVQVWYLATMLLAPHRPPGPGGRGRTPPGSQIFTYLSYTDAASVQAVNRQTAVLKRCVANMKDPKRQNQRPHFTAEKAKAQEPGPKGHSGG